MKKIFVSFMTLFLCMGVFTSKTESQTFNKGDKVLNVGIGFPSTLGVSNATSSIPPLSVSLEFGIIDNLFNVDKLHLGIGGYLGFTYKKWSYNYYLTHDYYWSYTYIIPGVRGVVHYDVADKFDVYGGLMLGLEVGIYGDNWDDDTYYGYDVNDTYTDIDLDVFVGGRYYFTKNIAAYAEIGFAIAYFNVGLTFKF